MAAIKTKNYSVHTAVGIFLERIIKAAPSRIWLRTNITQAENACEMHITMASAIHLLVPLAASGWTAHGRLHVARSTAAASADRLPSLPTGPSATMSAAAAGEKERLLSVIAIFDEATKVDGTPSVDFGVKGGELDADSRAPRDLLQLGAFYATSQRVGEAADAVIAAVSALAAKGGIGEPTRGFGTPSGDVECALHGTWSNIFTTAADATFSPDSERGGARVSNTVDARSGRTVNCIDFLPREIPALRAAPPPPLQSLRVVLSAAAVSATRIELVFRRVRARLNLRLFGGKLVVPLTLVLPVPGPFLTRCAPTATVHPPRGSADGPQTHTACACAPIAPRVPRTRIAPLPHCPTAPLPFCPTTLLPHCPSAPLPLCPTAFLSHCPTAPHVQPRRSPTRSTRPRASRSRSRTRVSVAIAVRSALPVSPAEAAAAGVL